jgi:hypothetical protein
MPDSQLTPVEVETRLRALVNSLSAVGGPNGSLAQARDAEVQARHVYKAAFRRWMLSAECPRVERNGWTTSARDAWVEDKTADLEFAWCLATAAREAAQDHLRTLRDQASLVQSIGAFVRQSYELAGVGA